MRCDTGFKPIMAAIIRLYNSDFKDQKHVYNPAQTGLILICNNRHCMSPKGAESNLIGVYCSSSS